METNAYLGAGPLLLALFGFVQLFRGGVLPEKKRARMRIGTVLLFLMLFGLVAALGKYTPLYGLLVAVVPGFDLFRVPARWLLWIFAPLVLIAGLGMQALLNAAEDNRKSDLMVWAIAASALLAPVLIFRASLSPVLELLGLYEQPFARAPGGAELIGELARTAGRSVETALVLILITAVAGGLLLTGRLARKVSLTLIAGLLAIDLLLFWQPFRASIPTDIPQAELESEGPWHRIAVDEFRAYFYPETEVIAAIREAPEGRLLYTNRLLSYFVDQYTRELLPERTAVYGLPSMQGTYSLRLAEYDEAVEQIAFPNEDVSLPFGGFIHLPAIRDRRMVDAYNATRILTYLEGFEGPEGRQRLLDLGLEPARTYSFAPNVPPLELWTNPHAPGPAWLSSEADWPGLDGRVEDAEIEMLEGADRFASPDFQRVRVRVPENGVTLHFAENDYPNWQIVAASQNGEEVHGASGRSVTLDTGTWDVTRRFVLQPVVRGTIPLSFALMLLLPVGALILCRAARKIDGNGDSDFGEME